MQIVVLFKFCCEIDFFPLPFPVWTSRYQQSSTEYGKRCSWNQFDCANNLTWNLQKRPLVEHWMNLHICQSKTSLDLQEYWKDFNLHLDLHQLNVKLWRCDDLWRGIVAKHSGLYYRYHRYCRYCSWVLYPE
jgi:hypothetical protein